MNAIASRLWRHHCRPGTTGSQWRRFRRTKHRQPLPVPRNATSPLGPIPRHVSTQRNVSRRERPIGSVWPTYQITRSLSTSIFLVTRRRNGHQPKPLKRLQLLTGLNEATSSKIDWLLRKETLSSTDQDLSCVFANNVGFRIIRRCARSKTGTSWS